MVIGAIADDLTGATDLGLMFVRGGMKVIQCVGVPSTHAKLGTADVIVVALKTRTLEPDAAVRQSLEALAFLQDAGATRFYFKYCSTFDSTDEGNIGNVIDALMDALGEDRTIACPAMPANGRTVYQGHLFVGDVLLSESSMRDHPLTPMRDARLARVLGRQTRRPVSSIALPVVRQGEDALGAALEGVTGVAIVDAIDEDDLLRIAQAAGNLRLVTGGSGLGLGLALGLAAARGATTRLGDEVPLVPEPGGQVVLAGSCSAATRRQIAAAVAGGAPALKVRPVEIATGEVRVGDVVEFVRAARGDAPPIVYSSADPADVAATQAELGREAAGALVESFIATVAERLLADGVTRFVVAGGETSGAVTKALRAETLAIGVEIDPGVPWTSFRRNGRTVALALKSGNFGADDIFLKAWGLLG